MLFHWGRQPTAQTFFGRSCNFSCPNETFFLFVYSRMFHSCKLKLITAKTHRHNHWRQTEPIASRGCKAHHEHHTHLYTSPTHHMNRCATSERVTRLYHAHDKATWSLDQLNTAAMQNEHSTRPESEEKSATITVGTGQIQRLAVA